MGKSRESSEVVERLSIIIIGFDANRNPYHSIKIHIRIETSRFEGKLYSCVSARASSHPALSSLARTTTPFTAGRLRHLLFPSLEASGENEHLQSWF